jgi:hypothetical protein
MPELGALGRRALVPALAVLGITLGARDVVPPQALPASASAEIAAAGRAQAHVEAIAQEPHPVGSAAHDRAQSYLEAQLRDLGFSVRVVPGIVNDVPVRNVLGRMEGAQPGLPAVLLAAHYDSVPRAPGAGDDALGCAAILEAARALTVRGPLSHPLVIALTDGEERGLLGAKLLVEGRDPWVYGAKLVLNFDARGNQGPVWMFETHGDESAMLSLLGRSGAHVSSNSLAYAVYKRMPNNTDFTVFRRANLPGLSFAPIGNVAAYHAPADTPGNLSPRTLQQATSLAYGVVRAFDTQRPVDTGRGAIWFSLQGQLFVYPLWLATSFAALALFSLGFSVHALRKRASWPALVAAGTLTLMHLVLALALPQGSFVCAVPSVPLAFAWVLAARGSRAEPLARAVGVFLCGLLWTPLAYTFEQALGPNALAIGAVLALVALGNGLPLAKATRGPVSPTKVPNP